MSSHNVKMSQLRLPLLPPPADLPLSRQPSLPPETLDGVGDPWPLTVQLIQTCRAHEKGLSGARVPGRLLGIRKAVQRACSRGDCGAEKTSPCHATGRLRNVVRHHL